MAAGGLPADGPAAREGGLPAGAARVVGAAGATARAAAFAPLPWKA